MVKRSALALAALVLGVFAILPTAARAQEVGSATATPIQVTGPPDQRLNLVILGDGYTASEQQKFRDDVDRHLNILWSIEPYKSYRDYFNVYRIEIVSAESGVSCDPDHGNVIRNTPLHLGYATRCPADANARGITFGTGGSAAMENYVKLIPGVTTANRQVLAIANTDTYGGIGGTSATTAGSSPQGPLITPHELGHSLGNLQDEYPYSTRNVPGGKYTGGEPSSIHHTITSAGQMLTSQTKWWRWLGEESESGGTIGEYESGNLYSSGIWRPSQHSIMRWLGNHYDQIGREQMINRISGRRNTVALALNSSPTTAPVGPNEVLWVETPHPTDHALTVTWAINGVAVADTHDSRNLSLTAAGAKAGDTVTVTVVDNTSHVRSPTIRNSAAMTQTRTWTVGATPTTPVVVDSTFTSSTPTNRAVGRDDIVYVETTHPTAGVPVVGWTLDGTPIANPNNSRLLPLADQHLTVGTHVLMATVGSDSRTWTVDNVDPAAPAVLSTPLTTLPDSVLHNVYFETFDMKLNPQDDQPGYVVGEFRLDHDGWFNYFGWPDSPVGTPYHFTARGTEIKALIYGSLGTGGMSKAPFEQAYPDFKPGYGTHTVEHHAIDAAGNTGPAGQFAATVLPGAMPACTTTVTGAVAGSLVVADGVTCLAAGAHVGGAIEVRAGASLVANGATIDGSVTAVGAASVQLIGSTVLGSTAVSGSTVDVTLTGSHFDGGVTLTGNHSGDYGVKLAGNRVYVGLNCSGNDHGVSDFGAQNAVGAPKTGECGTLVTGPAGASTPVSGGVGGAVPATLSLVLGAPATFGAFVPGVERTYGATMAATVTSTAGDATLTVADPSSDHPGHLVNGAFALPAALKAGGSVLPATLQTYNGPVSNDVLSIPFSQAIGATDALRTGTYAKTLTFTLSTTTP